MLHFRENLAGSSFFMESGEEQLRSDLKKVQSVVRSTQLPLLLPPRLSALRVWFCRCLAPQVMFLSTLWTAAKWLQGLSVSDKNVIGWAFVGSRLFNSISHSATMHGILGNFTSYCTGQSTGLPHHSIHFHCAVHPVCGSLSPTGL